MKHIRDLIASFRLRAGGFFPYFGTRIYSPPDSVLFQRVRKEGVFERVVCDRMLRLVRPNTWFLDVGANLGLMSVPVLAGNATVHAISIEPSPNSFAHLTKTWESSSFRDRWKIVSRAVSNLKGTTDFVLADSGNSAFEGMRNTGRVEMSRTISVATSPLDEIWAEAGCPEVSLVKIDVEGAEDLVLQGATELLKQCRPAIIIEWTPANLGAYEIPVEKLLSLALALQYRVYELEHLIPISDPGHLRILCGQGHENFLLAPRDSSS